MKFDPPKRSEPTDEHPGARNARVPSLVNIKQYSIICKCTALPVENNVFYVVPKR